MAHKYGKYGKYSKQILIGLDQLCNAILGGWPDETLSSRCWRWEQDGKRRWPRKLVDALFFWDRNHCRESFESERLRLQLPPELRPTTAGEQEAV